MEQKLQIWITLLFLGIGASAQNTSGKYCTVYVSRVSKQDGWLFRVLGEEVVLRVTITTGTDLYFL